MKFKKADLQDLAYGSVRDTIDLDFPEKGKAEVLENSLEDHSRWSLQYALSFKFNDKVYTTSYERGATEYQDVGPFEYDPDEIEVPEAEAYTVQITKYRVKK